MRERENAHSGSPQPVRPGEGRELAALIRIHDLGRAELVDEQHPNDRPPLSYIKRLVVVAALQDFGNDRTLLETQLPTAFRHGPSVPGNLPSPLIFRTVNHTTRRKSMGPDPRHFELRTGVVAQIV